MTLKHIVTWLCRQVTMPLEPQDRKVKSVSFSLELFGNIQSSKLGCPSYGLCSIAVLSLTPQNKSLQPNWKTALLCYV